MFVTCVEVTVKVPKGALHRDDLHSQARAVAQKWADEHGVEDEITQSVRWGDEITVKFGGEGW